MTNKNSAWLRRYATIAILSTLVHMASSAHAIVTSDGDGTHVTTPGVPAFGINVDGVASLELASDSGFAESCTMSLISDTHLLTASHCLPLIANLNGGARARFDLSGGSTTIDIVGVALHPGFSLTDSAAGVHDIAVVELASPAPASIPRYGLYRGIDEVGKTTVAVGYGRHGHGAKGSTGSDNSKRAGLNLFETTLDQALSLSGAAAQPNADRVLVGDFDNGLLANDAFGALGLPELGFGDDEVGLASGDSGGPNFIIDGGQPLLAGVNQFGSVASAILPGVMTDVDSFFNGTWGEIWGSARVSSHTTFIDDAVSGVSRFERSVTFSDGQTHLVDSPDSTSVRLLDGPGASTTTLNIVTGGALDVDPRLAFMSSVDAREHSRIDLSGGSVGRISILDDATATQSGGTVTGFANLRNNSQWEMTGGSFANEVTLSNNSRITLFGGEIDSEFGIGVTAQDNSLVNVEGGTVRGNSTGIKAVPNYLNSPLTAAIQVTGGEVIGERDGIEVGGQATVHVSGGSVRGGLTGVAGGFGGDDEEDGIEAKGESEVNISDGIVQGYNGVSAFDDATISVSGGTITGILDGLFVNDTATVQIEGGVITATDDDSYGIVAFGDSVVTITDGEISGATGISLEDSSLIDIFGGTITGSDFVDLEVIGPDTMIRIFGHGFSEPLGLLSAVSGSVSGQFFDGTPFDFSFDRFDGGVIRLVPERTCLALCLAGLLLQFRRQRS